MSSTLSVFINGSIALEECRKVVQHQLRIVLSRRPDLDGDVFIGQLGDIAVTLFDAHGLEDDQQIPFTEYPLEIDLLIRPYYIGL
jgi:hypothetical protein